MGYGTTTLNYLRPLWKPGRVRLRSGLQLLPGEMQRPTKTELQQLPSAPVNSNLQDMP